jgi:tetratricopeptide (TPR) repeat protein
VFMKIAVFYILLLTTTFSFSQNEKSNFDEILFERASAIESIPGEICLGCRANKSILNKSDSLKIEFEIFTEKQISKLALENYEKLIDSFPKSRFRYQALLRKGEIEFYLEKNDDAEKSYLKLLNSNDFLIPFNSTFYQDEAYYKNVSAIYLAEIAIKKNEFEKAITYLDLSKKYRVKYFCANSIPEQKDRLDKLYLVCNKGLKK